MGLKQCIVIRRDLRMSVGKTAAQAAHASVSALEEARRTRPEWVRLWLAEGQKKIVLKADTAEEIKELAQLCDMRGIPHSIIQDAGLTELPPGTITALGIGPAPEEMLEPITGKLKLL